MDILAYARMAADTIIAQYTPEELPPAHRFHYHQGIFLTGAERLYALTGDEKYNSYIKAWVDCNIDADGGLPRCHLDEFDDIQPGMLLFRLYDETGDSRYKKALDTMANALEASPTNAKGGVWHKHHLKNQMWLDSMYMMGVIAAMYSRRFDYPYMLEKVYTQMKLMKEYMTDSKTGLMYHAWDDSRQRHKINKKTGLSEVFWGRAIGWFAAAVAEIIEIIGEYHPLRDEFIKAERDILKAVMRYQDSNTGLWYQVLDKADDNRNWLETSCSALFVYAAAKSMRLNIIDSTFAEPIRKGTEGVLGRTVISDGKLSVGGICVGTGVGTLEEYFARPAKENDLHGMGAFLLMATEVYGFQTHLKLTSDLNSGNI